MNQAIIPADFTTFRSVLANAGSCPELNTAWNSILERAEEVGPKGLNELWDFYLDRLDECERGKTR